MWRNCRPIWILCEAKFLWANESAAIMAPPCYTAGRQRQLRPEEESVHKLIDFCVTRTYLKWWRWKSKCQSEYFFPEVIKLGITPSSVTTETVPRPLRPPPSSCGFLLSSTGLIDSIKECFSSRFSEILLEEASQHPDSDQVLLCACLVRLGLWLKYSQGCNISHF